MMDNLRFALEGGWKVLWVGVILGAGLPLVFALGIRSLALGSSGATTDAPHEPHPAGRLLAGLCFLLVLLAVALGITVIVAAGFGKVVSFDHVYPTLVPKG